MPPSVKPTHLESPLSPRDRKLVAALSRRNPADVGSIIRSQGLLVLGVGIFGVVFSALRLDLEGAGASAVLALIGLTEMERARLLKIIAHLLSKHRPSAGEPTQPGGHGPDTQQ